MCGIVSVVRRPSDRVPPDLGALRQTLADAEAQLRHMGAEAMGEPTVAALEAAARILADVDRQLREGDGVRALVDDPIARAGVAHHGDRAAELLVEIEARLDASAVDGADIEALNAALITCKDALWSIRKDRIELAVAVEDLMGAMPSGAAALDAFHAVQITLSAIDRLEVRGRDSAGLHVVVTGHGLDLDDPTIARLVAQRCLDPLFTAGSVRTPEGHLAFVYKTAAEIGELGDNTARLRAQIRTDDPLRLAEFLKAVRPNYDLVLLEGPPLSDPDAIPISVLADGVVLVVASGQTSFKMLERARQEMTARNVPILGTILNRQKRYIPSWV